MNCENCREQLDEYVDDSLSPTSKAAVEKHLAGCDTCREVARQERQLARALSAHFTQAVEKVELNEQARRIMARAVEREFNSRSEHPLALIWQQLGWFLAITSLILFIAIGAGYYFRNGSDSTIAIKHLSNSPKNSETSIHLAYRETSYTFQKKGDLVIDALTDDDRIADGTILVKK